MKRTHQVIVNSVDGTHTIGKYCSEEAAVRAAKNWLGDTFDTNGHRLSWVSMYGDVVNVERID